jgi:hypothetical protein
VPILDDGGPAAKLLPDLSATLGRIAGHPINRIAALLPCNIDAVGRCW